ncbi:DUF4124 domain-containing protein [Thiohalocapsa sp. ML1]|jgi:hypothetical protein|uniref:DUF4124 domain-containing protein n=1 Tax=Thiohalocapsa sp. ML1 TaxID=1431688 RepID=UPI0007321E13|nr:DUF4124 domain-containing protein [Thiohalocapsa sp. ML1]
MRRHGLCLTLTALLWVVTPVLAGQQVAVCRDANGNAYFSDQGCPEDTTPQGREYVPSAQSYSGRESIDTRVLNNWEQRNRTGRSWEWRNAPAGQR